MSPDPKLCPKCGQPNACREANGNLGHCWCESFSFPPEVTNLVPAEARGVACLCFACSFPAGPPSKTRGTSVE